MEPGELGQGWGQGHAEKDGRESLGEGHGEERVKGSKRRWQPGLRHN